MLKFPAIANPRNTGGKCAATLTDIQKIENRVLNLTTKNSHPFYYMLMGSSFWLRNDIFLKVIKKNYYSLILVVSLGGIMFNSLLLNSLFYSFIMIWLWVLVGISENSSRE